MFNAKYATISLASLVVFGLVTGIFMTWMPPSPRRLARDSHSGKAVGHRAVFELLEALDVPVRRHHATPPDLFTGDRRVLLLEPDFYRLEREHGYLDEMARWVRAGGELVLVSSVLKRTPELTPYVHREAEHEDVMGENRLLTSLGFEDLGTSFDAGEPVRRGPFGVLRKDHVIPSDPTRALAVRASGTLKNLEALAMELLLPESYDCFFTGADIERADGMIEIPMTAQEDGHGETGAESAEAEPEWRPIALEYGLGRGRVTLVACTIPFGNYLIGRGDNAVFAYHLAAGAGVREVVIDEFYHGGLNEGNWLALLGMYPYGAIALFILAAVLCYIWSSSVRFGPAVPEPAPSRRSITEYIEAMASLFWRGRKWAFVLATCEAGFLDLLREELRLSPSAPLDRILHRLHQLAPGKAVHLRETLAAIKAVQSKKTRLNPRMLLQFQEELEQCRIPKTSLSPQTEAPRVQTAPAAPRHPAST